MSQPMLIIGSGEAGVRAALTLREQQWEGGIIVLSDEQSTPYERPPLSKEFLLSDAPVNTEIAGFQKFSALDIDWRGGQLAHSIDPVKQTVEMQSGECIGFDKLLLATGATARTLHIPKVPKPSIFELRTDLDALRIRERIRPGLNVVIVGGGFIGLELAAALRQKEVEVHVLEQETRLMQRAVPSEIAKIMQEQHESLGVQIHFNTQIIDVNTRHDQRILTLSDGLEIQADLIIAGIGAIPNTQLALTAGLDIENGIQCDSTMQTSHPQIFSAGDCCSFFHPLYQQYIRLESWRTAQEQATVAAKNMLGQNIVYDKAPWFWSSQYDLTLQICGLMQAGDQQIERPMGDRSMLIFRLDQQNRMVAAAGIAPGHQIGREIKVCERLIQRKVQLDLVQLAQPEIALKRFLG